MRIIGIDPGTGILGFGVIDVKHGSTRLVTAGVITTPAHTPLPERLEEIYIVPKTNRSAEPSV
jgi:crossover junction endodeoxyribonuclease RuvC